MNDMSQAYVAGALVGGLVAGLICSAVPFTLARSRKRPDLAWIAFAVCLVGGLAFGLLLAVPAAIVCSVVVLALERGRDPTVLETWQATVAAPVELAPRGPAPAADAGEARPRNSVLCPVDTFAKNRLGQGELPIHCPSCGNTFAASAMNLPPWCTRCGADLKTRQANSPPPPPEPEAPAALPSAPPDAFQSTPPGAFHRANGDC
jgi:hypothetical protein